MCSSGRKSEFKSVRVVFMVLWSLCPLMLRGRGDQEGRLQNLKQLF